MKIFLSLYIAQDFLMMNPILVNENIFQSYEDAGEQNNLSYMWIAVHITCGPSCPWKIF